MTTSGTYQFSPALSDVVLDAYARINIRRPSLTAEHLTDAYNQANYLLVEFSNKQPNLWTSYEQSFSLVQGTATYSMDAWTVMILIAFIRTGSGSTQTDMIISPFSTVEYESIPTKETQGRPNTFWFNRQISPTFTLWPVPDGGGPYTAIFRTVRQVQDAKLANGTTLDTPYRFLDAFAAGLAHRLARMHAPALEAVRKQDAMEAWAIAATQDTENVPLFLVPGLSGYFR